MTYGLIWVSMVGQLTTDCELRGELLRSDTSAILFFSYTFVNSHGYSAEDSVLGYHVAFSIFINLSLYV